MGCSSSMGEHGQTIDVSVGEASYFHDTYSLGKVLHAGTISQVRAVRHTNEDYQGDQSDKVEPKRKQAVKVLDIASRSQAVKAELQIWTMLGNQNSIVTLFEAFVDTHLAYIVMQRCMGDLLQYLVIVQHPDERMLGGIFRQTLSGLNVMHSAGVVHRKIKPSNLLICYGEDGKLEGDDPIVKLSDFGCAAVLQKGQKLYDVMGSAPYLCPEMLFGKGYDQKADVWSLGIIAYALLFGKMPYTPQALDSKCMEDAIKGGRVPAIMAASSNSQNCPSSVEFVKALLNRNPQNRPTAAEAMHLNYMDAIEKKHYMHGEQLPSLQPMYLPRLWRMLRWKFVADSRQSNRSSDSSGKQTPTMTPVLMDAMLNNAQQSRLKQRQKKLSEASSSRIQTESTVSSHEAWQDEFLITQSNKLSDWGTPEEASLNRDYMSDATTEWMSSEKISIATFATSLTYDKKSEELKERKSEV